MAIHGTRGDSTDSASLPDIVPFDIPHLSRLSWELGSHVINDEASVRIGEWKHSRGGWRMSLFEVTNNTAIVRIRTSVGRKWFYGAIQSELEPARPELETAPSWRRAD